MEEIKEYDPDLAIVKEEEIIKYKNLINNEVKKYVDHIEDPLLKRELAIVAENQKIMNELRDSSGEIESEDSIKMAVNMMSGLSSKLVSVQASLGPCSLVYRPYKNLYSSEEIVAKTIISKCRFTPQDPTGIAKGMSIEELSNGLRNEIDLEILHDLKNNVGTIKSIKEFEGEELYNAIVNISDAIFRKTLKRATWLVSNPKVTEEVKKVFCGPIKVYSVEGFPDTILMGHRGDHLFDSPYVYAPYVMVLTMPFILDADTLMPIRKIIRRYGKKLYRDGSKHYGKIILKEKNG